jgi:glutamyl-tRNA synthetase
MNVITRFAPSPTGLLHIGSARTALFNYLFAKHHGGKFLLRVEDTDKKRSTDEATNAILDGLEWLGLKYDDKPFYQSHSGNRHKEVALKLLEEGKAYYCYTSAEELAKLRQESETKEEMFRFQSPWRDKKPSEPQSEKPVIRIKTPKDDGYCIIEDLVQGEVKVSNSELDDMIILRSDGTPTYNLAVVVDDHDMSVSHVIRGDDHLNNSFRQKIIYEAMGWKLPQVAHISLIHGPDGAKMSKRHGATGVMDYKELGYLPEAMRNYLLRLGWSHGDAEIISDEEAIEWFDLDKVGKSPSRFDFDKLNNLNKHYLKELDESKLLELVGLEASPNKEKFSRALHFLKDRAVNLNDLKEALKPYEDGFKKDLLDNELTLVKEKRELLKSLSQVVSEIKDWKLDVIKESLLNYAKENGIKMKDFGPALRVVLTFSSSSPGGMFDIINILGKEETLNRFNLNIN